MFVIQTIVSSVPNRWCPECPETPHHATHLTSDHLTSFSSDIDDFMMLLSVNADTQITYRLHFATKAPNCHVVHFGFVGDDSDEIVF
jgi:hypothetical protein